MAKRTDEMKAYENTKGDLEEQLRREIAERRNINVVRPSRDGKDYLGDFPTAVDSDTLYVTTNFYDKEGNAIPEEERVDSQNYTVETPASRVGFPSSVQEFGFNVETPASAYPTIEAVRQKALDNSAPRSKLIRDLREAGVSMPDFAKKPESENTDIFAFTNNLLVRPDIAGDAMQPGKAQGREAREANVARIRAQKDRVRGMQQMLASQGFYEGDPDGVYDEKTVKAIRAAQAAGVNVPPTAPR